MRRLTISHAPFVDECAEPLPATPSHDWYCEISYSDRAHHCGFLASRYCKWRIIRRCGQREGLHRVHTSSLAGAVVRLATTEIFRLKVQSCCTPEEFLSCWTYSTIVQCTPHLDTKHLSLHFVASASSVRRPASGVLTTQLDPLWLHRCLQSVCGGPQRSNALRLTIVGVAKVAFLSRS